MRTMLAAALAAAVLLLPAPAARAADSLATLRAALQSAVSRGDAAAVLAARARFAALAAADPKAAAPRYWVALCDWRAVPLLMESDRPQARRLAKDGLEQADRAVALAPQDGGAYALRAGLEGLSISLEPNDMMTLGSAAEEDLDRARRLAPDDPRVWLFDGINTLNKPAAFGGGAAPALERLVKAQALFAADTAATSPGWGHADACAWAGRAAMAQKDVAAAIAHYRKALEADPGNAWVARVLLPQADRAQKEAAGK